MTSEVKGREVTFPITGMTCVNCAATVERALKKTVGVTGVSVNYASERATVQLGDDAVGVKELAAAVERNLLLELAARLGVLVFGDLQV